MTAGALHRIPVQMLGDLVSPRALERILQDGAKKRGVKMDSLDAEELCVILKKDVFKRLQLSIPAPLAKKRVTEVLNELNKAPTRSEAPESTDNTAAQLDKLEEGARQFTLYFDWPESQRLRGLINSARKESEAGNDIDAMFAEGEQLIEQMGRKLEEGLVAQGQDLAELKESFDRVKGMGNRDVRRLENLIGQIEESQKEQTLIPGEVERARNLTFKLRKTLESSVVKTLDPQQTSIVEAEAQARVQALEQEHVARGLADLSREFEALFRARPDLELVRDELKQKHEANQLKSDGLDDWRKKLEEAKAQTLAMQRNELRTLEEQLSDTTDGPAASESRVALDVARDILASDALATDEIQELRSIASALSYSPEVAERILESQRDLSELERVARDVPGALEELHSHLTQAREELGRGHEIDAGPLWAMLERHMGQAAQQREDFDARADHVVAEYDKVRSLAGETTQRLGRMAEALRAQRRLGRLSADARERYYQTLTEAEALLTEAHAEYKAAQEVTSAFGQDALSDLLDVFEMGDTEGENNPFASLEEETVTGEESVSSSPTETHPAEVIEETPEQRASSVFDSMLTGVAPAAGVAAATVAITEPNQSNEPYDDPDRWVIKEGAVFEGPSDATAEQLAKMFPQAEQAGLQRLDMTEERCVWSARFDQPGQWRLGQANNWDEMDKVLGHWLETGERK